MSETKTITLAGKDIEVPRLPLRQNMVAYPLCRKLHNGDLMARIVAAKGALDCTVEEMEDLAELAFLAAKAADPTLERETFDSWAITPPELLDALFVIRVQTGGWVAASPEEGQAEPGEAKGAKKPPK